MIRKYKKLRNNNNYFNDKRIIKISALKRSNLYTEVVNFNKTICSFLLTRLLISPKPDREGTKLMFLSEWCEFPSVPCLAGKNKLDDSSSLDVVEIERVPDMLPSLFPSWSG